MAQSCVEPQPAWTANTLDEGRMGLHAGQCWQVREKQTSPASGPSRQEVYVKMLGGGVSWGQQGQGVGLQHLGSNQSTQSSGAAQLP